MRDGMVSIFPDTNLLDDSGPLVVKRGARGPQAIVPEGSSDFGDHYSRAAEQHG